MRPLHLTQPDEATALAMENDLLRLEVAHVRARLRIAEAELQRAERSDRPGKGAGAEKPENGGGPAPDEQDTLEDLRWLLRRIEALPLARVLHRRDGYRRLVETYLPEDSP